MGTVCHSHCLNFIFGVYWTRCRDTPRFLLLSSKNVCFEGWPLVLFLRRYNAHWGMLVGVLEPLRDLLWRAW